MPRPRAAKGAGTQLTRAVAFLRAHQGAVRLVTISIGGSDLYALKGASIFDIGSINTYMVHLGSTLQVIYQCLRTAAPEQRS